MKIRAFAGALALTMITAVGASAQQLESGKWTGKVIVPVEGAPQMDIAFDVKNEEGKEKVPTDPAPPEIGAIELTRL